MTSTRIEPIDRTVTVNGLNLHVVDWGSEGKPPFVLLHGFSSQARYWDGFAVRMREDYHVYAVDQRGHGESDWAPEYPPAGMPNDLLGIADQLGLERFTLLGHSMGGQVAMQFTTQHPERVERLIVVDAGLTAARNGPGAENSVTRALARDTFASEAELLAHYRAMNPALDIERARKPLMYNFRTLPDGRVTYRFDPALRDRFRDPARLAERQQSTEETRARARDVQVPVLLIRGGRSDILTPEGAAETIAAFPNARLVEIPETTHMVPTDNPPAFRAAIREWLGLKA